MKLFSSLYQGTLRGRSDEILVFTNLLAYADQRGVVDKHFKAIADETGLPLDRVQAAIEALEAPDKESRSPEMDGCRIVRMDEHRVWGWNIVNYGKYRAIRNEDDRREQNRLAQERWRNRNSKQSKQDKPPSSQAEGEGEGEATSKASGSRKNGARHASQDETPVIQTLPLREGGEFEVHQSLVAELEPLYPKVDVAATVREMKGWLVLNPERRKTKKGIKRFIGSWLQSEQQKAGG